MPFYQNVCLDIKLECLIVILFKVLPCLAFKLMSFKLQTKHGNTASPIQQLLTFLITEYGLNSNSCQQGKA